MRDSMINLAEQPLSSTAFSEHFPSYNFLSPEIVPFSLSCWNCAVIIFCWDGVQVLWTMFFSASFPFLMYKKTLHMHLRYQNAIKILRWNSSSSQSEWQGPAVELAGTGRGKGFCLSSMLVIILLAAPQLALVQLWRVHSRSHPFRDRPW